MKALILAGGLGTRISEETYLKPKPMIDIRGRAMFSNQSLLSEFHKTRASSGTVEY
jgi:dTDP-glucose pyrophosphorylase